MFKDYEIQTPFGTMKATPTNGTHISVMGLDKTDLMVNNVAYHVHVHFFKWQDGNWHVGNESDSNQYTREMNAVYMRKRYGKTVNDCYPSDAAKKKVLNVLPGIIDAWAKAHTLTLNEAEHEELTNQVARLEADAAELEKQAKAKRQEAEELKAKAALIR